MTAKSHQDLLLMRWALCSTTGLAFIVILYSTGLTPAWGLALRTAMAHPPFLMQPDAPMLSPGMGFLLCIMLTLTLVYNLLLIRGTGRKAAVLAASLILTACFTPALGLWGVFFNSIPFLFSLATAGLAAILRPHPPHAPNPTPLHE